MLTPGLVHSSMHINQESEDLSARQKTFVAVIVTSIAGIGVNHINSIKVCIDEIDLVTELAGSS